MPDFLPAAELAAKSVRDLFGAVGALVHAVIPPVRVDAAAEALAEKEAEEEVWAGDEVHSLSADEVAALRSVINVDFPYRLVEPASSHIAPLSACPCESLEDSCFWCEDAIDIEGPHLETVLDLVLALATIPMTPAAGAVSDAVEEGSPAGVPLPAGDAPTWAEIATPAIEEVLETHRSVIGGGCWECCATVAMRPSEWRNHVASLIAARLEEITLALPETETAPRYIKPLQ